MRKNIFFRKRNSVQSIFSNGFRTGKVIGIRFFNFGHKIILNRFVPNQKFLIKKNNRLVPGKEIFLSVCKSALAGLVMVVAVYCARANILHFGQPFWDLAVYGIFGAAVYLITATILRCREMEVFKDTVFGFIRKP